MARSKRWTIPFVTLSGIECRIDIYDEGWNGGVTTLSTANVNAPGVPATDPIYYEETDDESLLEVIRYRTGYINLIETTYNGLIDLYPETNTEHYIEFYYGNTLDFTGYIQAQAFENEFTASPREVSLPIISPLGLLDGLKFAAQNPPGAITLGALLKQVIDGLNAAYTEIVYPWGGSGGSSAYSLADEVSTLIVSPFNDEFNKHDGTEDDLFVPEKYKFFVEGLCNMLGWMVHDTPTSIVFTDFHYAYPYYRCAVENLPTMSGASAIASVTGGTLLNIDDYFSFRDSQAAESVVNPYSQIEKQFGGEIINNIEFPYDRMRLSTIDDNYTYNVAELRPVGPELSGLSIPGYVTSSGKTQPGVSPCVLGLENSTKKCLTFTCPNGGYSENTEMFTWNIYNHPPGEFFISVQMSWGEDINNLKSTEGTDIKFKVAVTGGSLAYGNLLLINNEGGSGRITIRPNSRYGVVTLTLMHASNNGLVTGTVYSFDTLTVQQRTDSFHEYVYNESDQQIVNGNNASTEDASVNMPFSYERDNSGLVGNEVIPNLQYYTHLLRSQNRIKAIFTPIQTLPAYLYIPKWQYWVSSWRWRMIAVSFHPWDDEYQLTLHRSSTIE